LVTYLRAFKIPEDYQERILEAHNKLKSAYQDIEKQRGLLEARLSRLKELYEWGHKTKTEYLTEYATVEKELKQLVPDNSDAEAIRKLALFLRDVVKAWEQASSEQRNHLSKCLFEMVWIKDKKIVAVTPRPDFKPFFDLNYEDMSQYVLQIRPRGDLNP
jgi:hypothetical protein